MLPTSVSVSSVSRPAVLHSAGRRCTAPTRFFLSIFWCFFVILTLVTLDSWVLRIYLYVLGLLPLGITRHRVDSQATPGYWTEESKGLLWMSSSKWLYSPCICVTFRGNYSTESFFKTSAQAKPGFLTSMKQSWSSLRFYIYIKRFISFNFECFVCECNTCGGPEVNFGSFGTGVTVVSCRVNAGNQTWGLWRSNLCSKPLSHRFSPVLIFKNCICIHLYNSSGNPRAQILFVTSVLQKRKQGKWTNITPSEICRNWTYRKTMEKVGLSWTELSNLTVSNL